MVHLSGNWLVVVVEGDADASACDIEAHALWSGGIGSRFDVGAATRLLDADGVVLFGIDHREVDAAGDGADVDRFLGIDLAKGDFSRGAVSLKLLALDVLADDAAGDGIHIDGLADGDVAHVDGAARAVDVEVAASRDVLKGGCAASGIDIDALTKGAVLDEDASASAVEVESLGGVKTFKSDGSASDIEVVVDIGIGRNGDDGDVFGEFLEVPWPDEVDVAEPWPFFLFHGEDAIGKAEVDLWIGFAVFVVDGDGFDVAFLELDFAREGLDVEGTGDTGGFVLSVDEVGSVAFFVAIGDGGSNACDGSSDEEEQGAG